MMMDASTSFIDFKQRPTHNKASTKTIKRQKKDGKGVGDVKTWYQE